MAKVVSMLLGIPGVEVWMNYNAANQRVTTIDWTLPRAGLTAWARIWNNTTLVYDRTIISPVSGSESIPGNIRLVLLPDPLGGPDYYQLPTNITWAINIEVAG